MDRPDHERLPAEPDHDREPSDREPSDREPSDREPSDREGPERAPSGRERSDREARVGTGSADEIVSGGPGTNRLVLPAGSTEGAVTPARPTWWAHGRRLLRRGERRRRAAENARPTTAFVMAGGGTRGAVQVGMLSELVERGIVADRVYGASVGAINGAAYAGDPTPEGMKHLESVWRNLTGADIFPRGRVHGPWLYLQHRPSVHSNAGLRRVITEGLRFEDLTDAVIPLEVVATSLTDGLERWFSRGPAAEAVLASAAIPAMFPPVVIDGDVLVDGGVVNNVPIRRAIEQGATRIYVLLCGPLHYHPAPTRRPAEAVVTALFMAVHARFARELALLPPGVEVIVFSGGGDPSATYRDFSMTPELIDEGRVEVAAVLDRYDGSLHDLGAR